MRISGNFSLVTLSIAVLFTYSCSKQEGCIDPNAANYIYEAKKNDGSCLYDLSFWMNTVIHGSVDISVDQAYRGRLNCAWPVHHPTCGVDTLLNTGYQCVLNVALVPGNHFVRVEAEDGTVWENTYLLKENCLSVLITD
jgi:hypothetical protein